ncbi:MAG TPA: hypothetical protein VHH36_09025 [Candidatus Thermoplasmatota archaeon]|nr:hypothetical protein [Candidatus Thermoplasmatota archaeon]
MRLAPVALALGFALAALPPVGADAAGGYAEGGWTALRVRLHQGVEMHFVHEAILEGEFFARSVEIVKNGAVAYADLYTLTASTSTLDVMVGAPVVGPVAETADARANALVTVDTTITCAGNCEGLVVTVIGILGGDVRAGSWRVGGAGFDVLGYATGGTVLAARGEDFFGAQAALRASTLAARAGALATMRFHAPSGIAGVFGSFAPAALASHEGPGGSSACPCALGPADGAGAHEFTFTEAGAGLGNPGAWRQPVLLVADVLLPPG